MAAEDFLDDDGSLTELPLFANDEAKAIFAEIAKKRELLENAPDLFEGKRKAGKQSDEPSTDELYREIGRLTVERDFLSRKLDQ